MITLDLTGGDSILVEEKSEKRDDVTHQDDAKEFSRYQRPTLQLVLYHLPE